ncbi:hypothetical protein D3C78_1395360 [compost metagenome]
MCQTDQLFLAAGELVEIAHRQMRDAEFMQNVIGFLFGIAVGVAAAGTARNDHRFQGVQMHSCRKRLRQIHHFLRTHCGRQGHQILTVEGDFALRRIEVCQRAQQG